MELYDKIKAIYPDLTDDDFLPRNQIIVLRNDNNGQPSYIALWNHPTLSRPTDEQLKGIN